MAKFKQGDTVRWSEGYAATEEERKAVFIVLEPGDDGKCFIRPIAWNSPYRALIPTFFVRMDMLELVEEAA